MAYLKTGSVSGGTTTPLSGYGRKRVVRRRPPALSDPDVTSRARFFPWVPTRERRAALGAPAFGVGCDPNDCRQGQLAVDLLYGTYLANSDNVIQAALQQGDNSSDAYQRALAIQSRYSSAVLGIKKQAEDANTVWARFAPLVSRGCCAMAQIGPQAEAVLKQLTADLNIVDPIQTTVQTPPGIFDNVITSAGDVAKWALIGVAVIFIAPSAIRAMSKSKKHAEAT